MLREAAGRLQHFQDRSSISRKVTCHQSRHIACNITRQITRHIARQITLYITRQIIIIIVSHCLVGTVAISYQVPITFSRKANLGLSLQHLYIYILK